MLSGVSTCGVRRALALPPSVQAKGEGMEPGLAGPADCQGPVRRRQAPRRGGSASPEIDRTRGFCRREAEFMWIRRAIGTDMPV